MMIEKITQNFRSDIAPGGILNVATDQQVATYLRNMSNALLAGKIVIKGSKRVSKRKPKLRKGVGSY